MPELQSFWAFVGAAQLAARNCNKWMAGVRVIDFIYFHIVYLKFSSVLYLIYCRARLGFDRRMCGVGTHISLSVCFEALVYCQSHGASLAEVH